MCGLEPGGQKSGEARIHLSHFEDIAAAKNEDFRVFGSGNGVGRQMHRLRKTLNT